MAYREDGKYYAKENKTMAMKPMPMAENTETLTSSNNLNNITELGTYTWAGTNAPLNTPITTSGVLTVNSFYSEGYVLQTVQSTSKIATRYGNGTTWGPWTFLSSSTTCSATSKVTGMSAPGMRRVGGTVIADIALQLVAGTYTGGVNGTQLWQFSPAPTGAVHFLASVAGNLTTMLVASDGKVYFNSNQTISGTPYIIGECVYLTDD